MKSKESLAGLVWFDPGSTTGVFSCFIESGWLRGEPDFAPTFAALGKAIHQPYFEQLGNKARREVVGNDAKRNVSRAFRETLNLNGDIVDLSCVIGAELPDYVHAETQIIAASNQLLRSTALWRCAWGYEDFVPRSLNQSREFLSPVRIFSALTALELLAGDQRAPFTQSASIAKTTVTDARLQLAGLYRPGMPHAVDAARHALTFFRRARSSPKLRQQAWPHLFDPKG